MKAFPIFLGICVPNRQRMEGEVKKSYPPPKAVQNSWRCQENAPQDQISSGADCRKYTLENFSHQKNHFNILKVKNCTRRGWLGSAAFSEGGHIHSECNAGQEIWKLINRNPTIPIHMYPDDYVKCADSRQTDRQTVRQTERQIHRRANIHLHICTQIHTIPQAK